MQYPLPEILDRLSIVILKIERLKDNRIIKEYNDLVNALKEFKCPYEDKWFRELKDINGQIWDLEADIRNFLEDKLGLEEVGKRALAIRDKNKIRISIKNRIQQETNEGYLEVKGNHRSE
ncbi:MAG: hypothetical protein M0R17_02625 [Candidatus Omnitrophica bacterium]|jgi:hypothetical protein|nr:hypothetical protein [Candidatus Omnitrophota bacterium]